MHKTNGKNKKPKKFKISLKESLRRNKLGWLTTIGLGLFLVAVFTFTNQHLWRYGLTPKEPLDIAHENLPEPGQNTEFIPQEPGEAEGESIQAENEAENSGANSEEDIPAEGEALEAWAAPEIWLPPALGKWERAYGFGLDPTYEDYRFHSGLDMPLPLGELVFAVAGGNIIKARPDALWGGRVKIEHGGQYTSVYLGITPAGIKEGQTVEAGETIATIAPAPAAEKAQESHLHFELLLDGKTIDPWEFFNN